MYKKYYILLLSRIVDHSKTYTHLYNISICHSQANNNNNTNNIRNDLHENAYKQ